MEYTIYGLVWLFFTYSFIGWCVEVCAAAIRKRKFINRGFVAEPLCPIYGNGAILFAIFLSDLKTSPFFLFLGGVILASILEYSTGKLLETIFKKKWWDYTGNRFSLDGYICLKYSLLWGVFALLLIYFMNPFLLSILEMIPYTMGFVAAIVLFCLLLLDITCSAIALLGMQKRAKQLAPITEGMQHASKVLENAITKRIQKRMQKAFPSLSEEDITLSAKEKSTVFAEGCSFYKLIALFFIGAFLGDITETIFCFITTGVLMSRSSVVYGPFSIVWGLGCAFLTALLYRYKESSDRHIFIAGTLLGGAYEYICSVFTELVFGTIFWDYSGFAFNLGGRINLLYCFFWGIAAVVWFKMIYPKLSAWIEKIPMKVGKIVFNILIIFMVFNMGISALALARYTERNTIENETETTEMYVSTGVDSEKNWKSSLIFFLDKHFPDERMEKIYPNAKIVEN